MNEHLRQYRVLKMLLKNSKMELKGDAVVMAALAFKWFDELEEFLKKLESEGKIKEVKEPIKKVKNANK